MLIILDSTSRTLKAEMAMDATTSNCTAVVAYADNNGTTFTEGSTPTSLNGMTAVTILAAPASGVRRIVKSVCIYNPDTETHTTTLIFNDNGTEYPITRLTLAPGASWSSDDQTGVNVGGVLTDGDKGDISVSSGGTTWTIDNDAVTYAKLQNVTDARLLGRSAGSNGDAQEITVGTGLSLSAGSLTATASGVSDGDKGDITVSSSGATWTVDNGAITYAKIQNVTDARLLGRSSGTAGTAQEITVGTGLSLSQGATPTLTATGGSMVYPGAGIAVSNGTAWITPKNSPTGDVVGTSDSQALTNKTINGASNTISNINLASQVTGTLPVANGGTGLTSTPANGQLDIGNGTGFTRATLTAGSNITITNGAGAITIASTASGGGGGAAFKNALINGDFAVAQRGTSFTSATTFVNSDDAYTLDRWYILSDGNNTIDVSRSTDAPTNQLTSMLMDVSTTSRKFGIAQIVEQSNCVGLIGQNVSLSFKAKVSAITNLDNIKAAIISWSGTADTVTSDIISAWGAEGTNPTLIADATYENSPANLSVTTSWATYKIENIAIDTASTKNIIVFIWSDVTTTAGTDLIYVTDVQLEKSATATDFERLPFDVNLSRCQRYGYYTGSDGLSGVRMIGFGFNGSGSYTAAAVYYPVSMRAFPVMTASALGAFSANNGSTFTSTSFGSASTRFSGFFILFGSFTNGQGNVVFATSGFAFFDAEL
jgi:hypothetical protein